MLSMDLCRHRWSQPERSASRSAKIGLTCWRRLRFDDALRGGFGAASFHLSYAHWQAYICPSSSLVMVPGFHPMALRAC